MKIRLLLTASLVFFLFVSSYAIDGCRIGALASGSRIYVNTATQCPVCPNNSEPWSGGKNYIIFSSAASECNSSPYNNVNVEYVRLNQITSRTNAFGNTSCYITNGSGFTSGTSVSFVRFYNCPLDDYIPWLILPIGVLMFFHVRRRNLVLS